MRNYYEILGLERNATDSEIKKAYYMKAKETHPDKTKQNTEDQFRVVFVAFQVLSDEKTRAAYDTKISKAEACKQGLAAKDTPIYSNTIDLDMNFDALYKFVFIGSSGSFKEEIVKTACEDFDPNFRRAIIGLDFKAMTKAVEGIGKVRLNLFITGEQLDRNTNIIIPSCRNSNAYVLVLSVTNEQLWRQGCEDLRLYKNEGFFENGISSLVLVYRSSNEKIISDETIDEFCREFNISDKIAYRLSDRKGSYAEVSKLLDVLCYKSYQNEYYRVLKEIDAMPSDGDEKVLLLDDGSEKRYCLQ